MRFILFIFFVLLTSYVFAQQSKTLHPTDSATVTGTVTDKKGKFTLQQIPANSIERIEVITIPSASTSGIINIVLKKNSKAGSMMIIHMTFLLLKKYI